ncbi:MAG: hypothetical protein JWR25_926 [Noviherbaspirillum sp.]|nr:hypothetical protein [Noviherbaspirillum sp.]
MPKYGLKAWLTLFAVMLAITTTAGLGLIVEKVATSQLKQRSGDKLTQRSVVLADRIDYAMFERYRDMQLHASMLSMLDLFERPSDIRSRLNELRSAYEGYVWIGYAARDGKVLAATDGVLEGENISERPLFNRTTEAAFVGDVHRAILLEKKLNPEGRDPLRLLDIAVPVLDRQGKFAGVLGAHIDWRLIKNIAASLPQNDKADVLVLSADTTVLLGPSDLQDRTLSLASIRRASNGGSGYEVERWPDGKTYLTGYSQGRGYRDYPGLNWIILERQEIGIAFAPALAFRQQVIMWGIAIAVLFALLGWLVAARIARPLTSITQAAEALQRGNPHIKIPLTTGYREVSVLSSTLSTLIDKLTQREAQLEHQATHHPLTQLPNRALVKAVLNQTISQATKEHRQVAVLIAGLDRFKAVNDTLGHAGGDNMLRSVAERLAACIGASGTLGHLGRDEFAVVLEENDITLPQTTLLATRLQESIEAPFAVAGIEFFLSLSIGISQFPKDGQDAEALLSYSEAALHQAKQKGGNHIEFYEAQLNVAVLERLALERELRQALDKQQFELHYQPQVSFKTGAIVGVEALIRWRHPERGLIPPLKFIPLAEASGLIVPIGDWVLNEACAQAMVWRAQGLAPVRMGVNVSARQFSDEKLVQRVSDALSRSGLEPTYLKLEITESLLMQEVEHSIRIMQDLADLGLHIAIDDFGTGYSSLSYLKRFPISELKIDQAFVRDLTSHSDDAAIVRAIISLGHNLKLSVIAEGVETGEQASFLRQADCDEMQGYSFSRPLPADGITALLRVHASERGGP